MVWAFCLLFSLVCFGYDAFFMGFDCLFDLLLYFYDVFATRLFWFCKVCGLWGFGIAFLRDCEVGGCVLFGFCLGCLILIGGCGLRDLSDAALEALAAGFYWMLSGVACGGVFC